MSWGSSLAGGDSHDVQHKLSDVIHIQATNSAFAAIRSDGSVVTRGDPRNGGNCETAVHGSVVTWGAAEAGGDCQKVWGEQLELNRAAFCFCGPRELPNSRRDWRKLRLAEFFAEGLC